ncbi:unnamed protein product [Mucor fragilis]
MAANSDMVVMIATTAFALGIDLDCIRFIYNLGIPDSILDYAQASGRAKRDDRSFSGPADCTSITSEADIKSLIKYRMANCKLPERAREQHDFKVMEAYINTTDCRRYIIQAALDNIGVSCSSTGGFSQCDNCQRNMIDLMNTSDTQHVVSIPSMSSNMDSTNMSMGSSMNMGNNSFGISNNSKMMGSSMNRGIGSSMGMGNSNYGIITVSSSQMNIESSASMNNDRLAAGNEAL